MDGIVNIYKEAGYTSFDVVAKLRGILRERRMGHTGTLDPQATGVLPVCVGKATKLCELLLDKEKAYEAVMLLGVTTDTEDMTGTVLTEQEVRVTEEELRAVAEKFTGVEGVYVPLSETIRSFKAIINGEADEYPENAFFNVGTIEDVATKAEALAREEGNTV
mgnify:CR=1 FL=1